MELQEHGHQDCDDAIEHESNLDDDIFKELVLILFLASEIVCVETPSDGIEPSSDHRDCDEVSEDKNIYKEQDKELSIPKANAVVDPRAMMVHV